MPLDQCRNVAVVGPHDEITFPMPRYGAIFYFRWAFTDRDGILNFTQLKTLLGYMARPPNSARTAQTFLQFLLQNPTGLNIKAAIDGFM